MKHIAIKDNTFDLFQELKKSTGRTADGMLAELLREYKKRKK